MNKNEKICLTLVCRGINRNGLDRFRTEAFNLDQQTYYFNVQNNDQLFNVL